jgi:hypothetical protein
MTVSELIARLQHLPQDLEVVVWYPPNRDSGETRLRVCDDLQSNVGDEFVILAPGEQYAGK